MHHITNKHFSPCVHRTSVAAPALCALFPRCGGPEAVGSEAGRASHPPAGRNGQPDRLQQAGPTHGQLSARPGMDEETLKTPIP